MKIGTDFISADSWELPTYSGDYHKSARTNFVEMKLSNRFVQPTIYDLEFDEDQVEKWIPHPDNPEGDKIPVFTAGEEITVTGKYRTNDYTDFFTEFNLFSRNNLKEYEEVDYGIEIDDGEAEFEYTFSGSDTADFDDYYGYLEFYTRSNNVFPSNSVALSYYLIPEDGDSSGNPGQFPGGGGYEPGGGGGEAGTDPTKTDERTIDILYVDQDGDVISEEEIEGESGEEYKYEPEAPNGYEIINILGDILGTYPDKDEEQYIYIVLRDVDYHDMFKVNLDTNSIIRQDELENEGYSSRLNIYSKDEYIVSIENNEAYNQVSYVYIETPSEITISDHAFDNNWYVLEYEDDDKGKNIYQFFVNNSDELGVSYSSLDRREADNLIAQIDFETSGESMEDLTELNDENIEVAFGARPVFIWEDNYYQIITNFDAEYDDEPTDIDYEQAEYNSQFIEYSDDWLGEIGNLDEELLDQLEDRDLAFWISDEETVPYRANEVSRYLVKYKDNRIKPSNGAIRKALPAPESSGKRQTSIPQPIVIFPVDVLTGKAIGEGEGPLYEDEEYRLDDVLFKSPEDLDFMEGYEFEKLLNEGINPVMNFPIKFKSSVQRVVAGYKEDKTLQETTVTVVYKDQDGKIITSSGNQPIEGHVGTPYNVSLSIPSGYELVNILGELKGTFAKENKIIDVFIRPINPLASIVFDLNEKAIERTDKATTTLSELAINNLDKDIAKLMDQQSYNRVSYIYLEVPKMATLETIPFPLAKAKGWKDVTYTSNSGDNETKIIQYVVTDANEKGYSPSALTQEEFNRFITDIKITIPNIKEVKTMDNTEITVGAGITPVFSYNKQFYQLINNPKNIEGTNILSNELAQKNSNYFKYQNLSGKIATPINAQEIDMINQLSDSGAPFWLGDNKTVPASADKNKVGRYLVSYTGTSTTSYAPESSGKRDVFIPQPVVIYPVDESTKDSIMESYQRYNKPYRLDDTLYDNSTDLLEVNGYSYVGLTTLVSQLPTLKEFPLTSGKEWRMAVPMYKENPKEVNATVKYMALDENGKPTNQSISSETVTKALEGNVIKDVVQPKLIPDYVVDESQTKVTLNGSNTAVSGGLSGKVPREDFTVIFYYKESSNSVVLTVEYHQLNHKGEVTNTPVFEDLTTKKPALIEKKIVEIGSNFLIDNPPKIFEGYEDYPSLSKVTNDVTKDVIVDGITPKDNFTLIYYYQPLNNINVPKTISFGENNSQTILGDYAVANKPNPIVVTSGYSEVEWSLDAQSNGLFTESNQSFERLMSTLYFKINNENIEITSDGNRLMTHVTEQKVELPFYSERDDEGLFLHVFQTGSKKSSYSGNIKFSMVTGP